MRRLFPIVLLVFSTGCGDPSRTLSEQAASGGTPSAAAAGSEPAKRAAADVALDWPCWRGRSGDGISRETDWKATWDSPVPEE